MSAWWYHLWNDPIRHNPWSLAALVVIVVGVLAGLATMETTMFRRRRKETTVTEANDPKPVATDDEFITVPPESEPKWVKDKHEAAGAIAEARTGSRVAMWTPEMDRPDPTARDTVVQEAQWRSEGLPPVEPEEDGGHLQLLTVPADGRPPYPSRLGRATVPKAVVNQHREPCEHCGGTGYMPGISDYLRESIALLGDQGDAVVRQFYTTLFRSAPDLVSLFPGNPTEGDLGTDHKGAHQRELLLAALVALSDLYDPDDFDRMQRLDTALGSFGRKHASFARPNGTIQGATLDEYKAVKDALFATLVSAAGNAWKAEYTAAWSEAYDYAASVMLAEQFRSGFNSPRFVRG